MATSRKKLISIYNTEYYHCSSRCVRGAYLCGVDKTNGKNYSHRRDWLENKILYLATIFAIDVAAYAIMDNHYHTVLHINPKVAKLWSDKEVIRRWHLLFKGTSLSQKYIVGSQLECYELKHIKILVNEWRQRLQSISWFMSVINERLARLSNKEDGCKGRFWEGRFSSKALLDEAALITCMIYVDLNPLRAKIADIPEKSPHTSVKLRCKFINSNDLDLSHHAESSLFPFVGDADENDDKTDGIQMTVKNYLLLLDSTGRAFKEGKRGVISASAQCILTRLKIDMEHWVEMTSFFGHCFSSFVGNEKDLRNACVKMKYRRVPGLAACRQLFN